MEIRGNSCSNGTEALAIFIDYHNLEGSLRHEGTLVDVSALTDYLARGRRLLETFVYVGFNPNNLDGDHHFHHLLKTDGFLVRTKLAKVRPDGSLKCDLDIEMVLDVTDYVHRAKPEIVLLITGDGDFVPLVAWLRLRGVRVEVASTPRSISQDLREAANGYVDLCKAIEEIERGRGEFSREEVSRNGNGSAQRQAGGDSTHGDG